MNNVDIDPNKFDKDSYGNIFPITDAPKEEDGESHADAKR